MRTLLRLRDPFAAPQAGARWVTCTGTVSERTGSASDRDFVLVCRLRALGARWFRPVRSYVLFIASKLRNVFLCSEPRFKGKSALNVY
jgi:hypothetical protein